MRLIVFLLALLVIAGATQTRAAAPEQATPAPSEAERWRTWLDDARQSAAGGDLARAALVLERFLRAADAHLGRLEVEWVLARNRARRDVASHDAEVLKTRARVSIESRPEGAEVWIQSRGATTHDKVPTTPFVGYFDPGAHTVRLFHPSENLAREVTFEVRAGSVRGFMVDLRGEVVTDTVAPALLGQLPPTPDGAPQAPPADDAVILIELRAPDPTDDEGPPITSSGTSLVESLGTVSIAAGGAALAVGTTFALVASGLDDEAACSGSACDVDRVLRDQVRRDADVAWDRATGMFIAGGVLVAGGVVALLLNDDGGPASSTSGVAPWLGPDGLGLSGRVGF